MSATLISEDTVNNLSDLFDAIKLLKKLDVSASGVTSLDDAKCRLLRFMKEHESNAGKELSGVSIIYSKQQGFNQGGRKVERDGGVGGRVEKFRE